MNLTEYTEKNGTGSRTSRLTEFFKKNPQVFEEIHKARASDDPPTWRTIANYLREEHEFDTKGQALRDWYGRSSEAFR